MGWTGSYDQDLEPYIYQRPVGLYPPVFELSDRQQFPQTEQLIRAAKAGLEISFDVAADSGLTLDLGAFREAISHLRVLRITDSDSIKGWSELSNARALSDFVILNQEPAEGLDIARLPLLANAGVIGENCLSVCDNLNVKTLALRLPKSRATPIIRSPLSGLSLTSKNSDIILRRMSHPEDLKSLLVVGARNLDCRTLLAFPDLRELDLYSCSGLTNAGLLADLPRLEKLELSRCRNVDDPQAVSRLLQVLAESD